MRDYVIIPEDTWVKGTRRIMYGGRKAFVGWVEDIKMMTGDQFMYRIYVPADDRHYDISPEHVWTAKREEGCKDNWIDVALISRDEEWFRELMKGVEA